MGKAIKGRHSQNRPSGTEWNMASSAFYVDDLAIQVVMTVL
jgi:hypothetical protein